jgi:hypothetical protein
LNFNTRRGDLTAALFFMHNPHNTPVLFCGKCTDSVPFCAKSAAFHAKNGFAAKNSLLYDQAISFQ